MLRLKRGTREFDWNRLWSDRAGVLPLDSLGLLQVPDSTLYSAGSVDLVSWDSFATAPCVVLLGEPGTGKSHEMRRRFEGTPDVILRDLRTYDSTRAVRDDVIDSPDCLEWRGGRGEVTLALDSLDEALLEIRVLGSWLLEQLDRLPIERLRLRLSCRTASWPQFLEAGLAALWGRVEVYEIAPLSRNDVVVAADRCGLDSDAFLREVVARDAGPLVSKPTTLRFLIDSFRRTGGFPSTQVELYRIGCTELCSEEEERVVSGRAGDLEPRERLAIASRLAAATIIGNHSAIARRRTAADQPSSAGVGVWELLGGAEPIVGGGTIDVSQSAIDEVLGSGLFTARGPTAFGWAHQTYGEFLAAN